VCHDTFSLKPVFKQHRKNLPDICLPEKSPNKLRAVINTGLLQNAGVAEMQLTNELGDSLLILYCTAELMVASYFSLTTCSSNQFQKPGCVVS
jgi:hypothetical protein